MKIDLSKMGATTPEMLMEETVDDMVSETPSEEKEVIPSASELTDEQPASEPTNTSQSLKDMLLEIVEENGHKLEEVKKELIHEAKEKNAKMHILTHPQPQFVIDYLQKEGLSISEEAVGYFVSWEVQ